MPRPLWQPRTNTAARLLGLGFASVGGAILYWQIVVTLQRAAAGDTEIMYSLKLIALGAMFAVLGLFWLAAGISGYLKIVGLQKSRLFLITLGIVAVVIIGIAHLYMQRELSAFGYKL